MVVVVSILMPSSAIVSTTGTEALVSVVDVADCTLASVT